MGIVLLMAYGLDGIHVGSLLCRYVAKEYADEHANHERDIDAPHGNARRHAEQRHYELAG